MFKEKVIILTTILVGASLLRFIPHPPNFTPIIAIGIISVTLFEKKHLQFGFPLIIMIVTDFFIGFHSLIPFVYGSIILASLTGFILKQKSSIINGIGASLLSSIIFFIISNLGVWILSSTYPKNVLGLYQCYIAAIPFFHNTVASTSIIVVGILIIDKYVINRIKDIHKKYIKLSN
tara:strand:+ start:1191 stop:1721 length:531 start_codon:yes stop_codon:yes gene_type:complete